MLLFFKKKREILLHLIIFIVKSLQKEQKSTNLLLTPPICRNKRAITPKWINSKETNFTMPAANAIEVEPKVFICKSNSSFYVRGTSINYIVRNQIFNSIFKLWMPQVFELARFKVIQRTLEGLAGDYYFWRSILFSKIVPNFWLLRDGSEPNFDKRYETT